LDQPAGADRDLRLGDLVAAPGAREEPEDLLALPGLVSALPELEREVIVLRFFQDLDQSQIAARIGYSQMHVSRLQRRALARMRARLVEPDQAKGAVAIQVIWMPTIGLVLALSGVLGLAVVTHVAAWTRRR
jgi:DNA-directed RNA polymerase specialized sigma24 family protein